MVSERDILELAREEEPLSLATAFDELDDPVPTIFLACRSLTNTGDLQRVGPGEYEITTQGRDYLTGGGFDWQTDTDADANADADAEDPDPAILAAFDTDSASGADRSPE